MTSDGEWVDPVDVAVGDYLLDRDGVNVVVDDVTISTVANQTVHNLTVDDHHTFYVTAGDRDVLTHNRGKDAPSS